MRTVKRLAPLARMATISLILLSTGCMTSLSQWKANGFKIGPNYMKPAAPVSEHWIDYQRDSLLSVSPTDTASWWTVLNDAQLSGLIQTAAQQNLTLRVAGTRIQQAQAIRGIAAGSLFPQKQVNFGSYDRIQLSEVNANNPPNTAFGQWNQGFNVSWELDFWGRYRRGVESADAALDASIEGYDNVLVLLISEVAETYVQLRSLQTQLNFLQQNVESQRQSLSIAEARLQGGLSDEVDVLQTRNNVEQTEALIPALESALRQTNNALCILLGIPPRDLVTELGEAPIPTAPPSVAVGVPAELLRRRPDVREAERLAAAQSARIGIAQTDLYPRIAINGTLLWQAEELNDVFTAPAFGGAVGPSYAWNILNYGRIRNQIWQQEALFDQAVYNYRNVVLQAQRETEDAMIGFTKSREQNEKLQQAVADIEKLEATLLTQAESGETDFNRVFVVQAQKTAQQNNLAVSQGEIALTLIRVYRSLGGGWEIRLGLATRPASPQIEVPPEVIPPAEFQEMPVDE